MAVKNTPLIPIGESDPFKSVDHSMAVEQDIGERQDILQLAGMVSRQAQRHCIR